MTIDVAGEPFVAKGDVLAVPGFRGIYPYGLKKDEQLPALAEGGTVDFLGSVAGNTALTMGARGGLFIGGGIAPRFTDFLRRSVFRERFEAKGRMSTYLSRIPTAVIVHPTPAFLGLAYLASTMGRRVRQAAD